MSDPSIKPPPLPSTIFYKSVRSYRNMRTFMLIATWLLCGTPFVLGLINHLTHRPTGTSIPVPLLYLISAFFLFAVYVHLSNCLRNVRDPIEINAEGIRSKHNFWYWTQVESLTPKKIDFARKYFILIRLRVDPRKHLLQPDEALTPRQYAAFVERIHPFLEAHHPTVKINPIPR